MRVCVTNSVAAIYKSIVERFFASEPDPILGLLVFHKLINDEMMIMGFVEADHKLTESDANYK